MGTDNNLSVELGSIFNHWAHIPMEDKALKKQVQLAMTPSKEALAKVRDNDDEAFSTAFKHTYEEVFAYGMMNETQRLETTKRHPLRRIQCSYRLLSECPFL